MEQIGQQKATGESVSSETSSDWQYPSTKREAIEMRDLGARISLTKNMAGNITMFLQSIGADNELPTNKADRVAWLNHFHTQLAVNNPLWPDDMSFGFVYGAFVNAIMYDRVELAGHNVHAFISAFKRWITQSGVEDNLRRRWREQNPEEAPKELTGREPEETAEDRRVQAEGYVNFPPHVVKEQIEILSALHGGWEEALQSVSGVKCYRRRLENTREKYLEEGKWPES